MMDLNSVYYFAKSVYHGGFAAAERALGIPKSKLSRHLTALEDSLGVRLIQRSSRQFVLTDAGQRYYEHCQAILVEMEAAQEAIDSIQSEPRGNIKVSCPVGLLKFHLGEMIARFMAQYPKVSIDLEATNRRVDVVAEGIDIAFRVRPLPLEDSNLVARVLSYRSQCLVAAPSLLKEYGHPQSIAELKLLPSLSRSQIYEHHIWTLNNGQEKVELSHKPRFTTTDMHALKEAALQGVGVVQLPSLMLNKELKSGQLLRVLPQWQPRKEAIHLVFPSRRGLLPSVRALIDFMVKQYEQFDEG